MQRLIEAGKKSIDEADPTTEVFMDILSNKHRLMVHLHKEDDAMVLI